MPLRTYGGVGPGQIANYGIIFWLLTTDDPANNEYNKVNSEGANAWTITEANVQQIIPRGITVDHIYVRISAAPGAGTSRTFTLRDDGANTTASVTLVTGAAGDYNIGPTITGGSALSIKHTLTGAPAAVTWVSIMVLYHTN